VRAEDARARREAEYLNIYVADDGSLIGSFRVSPERGLTVVHGLDAEAGRVADPIGEGDPDEAVGDRRGRRSRIDGLVALCERSLDQLTAAGPDAAGERYQLVIHAPVEALSSVDGADDDGAAVELQAPGGLTVRIGPGTTRRVTCDCPTTLMLHGVDGSAVHVGRRTRRTQGRLRRAVNARDRGRCRAPGCTQPATQIHHIRHWADGGTTCLANLISLCDQHHWLVHEGGFALVVRSPGRWALIGPDGVTVESAPPPPPPDGVKPLLADPTIAADAVTGRWNGDKLDHNIALEWLASTRRREKDVALAATDVKSASAEASEASQASEAPSHFQWSPQTIESWCRTVDMLDAVSRDPSVKAFYVEDE
jgi:hypothetical protein